MDVRNAQLAERGGRLPIALADVTQLRFEGNDGDPTFTAEIDATGPLGLAALEA